MKWDTIKLRNLHVNMSLMTHIEWPPDKREGSGWHDSVHAIVHYCGGVSTSLNWEQATLLKAIMEEAGL